MKGYMQNQSRTKRTTSTNIAFSAYLSHDMQNVAKNVIIKCDRTILNDQNAYNPIDGIFTAPVAGVYLFSFSADTYTDAFIKLVVDNANEADIVADPNPKWSLTESMSSIIVLVYMNIFQSAWIEFDQTTGQLISADGQRYTTFSGVLLYEQFHVITFL
ncbi:hypothetical protein DPMN_112212 [Dreissena polymorpha]|uniref:C1q domain-containing protein n=1 Tax=Dreissena polymorpha TaxID=45954 RepID=A0A9D4KGD7_DREPO|nr:hypothetical protein DPMN_112212 [Dreissena polymorpha]